MVLWHISDGAQGWDGTRAIWPPFTVGKRVERMERGRQGRGVEAYGMRTCGIGKREERLLGDGVRGIW